MHEGKETKHTLTLPGFVLDAWFDDCFVSVKTGEYHARGRRRQGVCYLSMFLDYELSAIITAFLANIGTLTYVVPFSL